MKSLGLGIALLCMGLLMNASVNFLTNGAAELALPDYPQVILSHFEAAPEAEATVMAEDSVTPGGAEAAGPEALSQDQQKKK